MKYKTKTPDFNISGLKTFNATGEEKDGIVINTDGSSLEIDNTTGKLQVKDKGIDATKLVYDVNSFKTVETGTKELQLKLDDNGGIVSDGAGIGLKYKTKTNPTPSNLSGNVSGIRNSGEITNYNAAAVQTSDGQLCQGWVEVHLDRLARFHMDTFKTKQCLQRKAVCTFVAIRDITSVLRARQQKLNCKAEP